MWSSPNSGPKRQYGYRVVPTLKNDRSFVSDLLTDPNDEAITRAVIAMGKSLDLKVVAEGVEDAQQAEFLRQQHCDQAQGYYYSPPVSAEKFEEMLRRYRV